MEKTRAKLTSDLIYQSLKDIAPKFGFTIIKNELRRINFNFP